MGPLVVVGRDVFQIWRTVINRLKMQWYSRQRVVLKLCVGWGLTIIRRKKGMLRLVYKDSVLAGPCEHGNELCEFTTGRNFFTRWSTVLFSRGDRDVRSHATLHSHFVTGKLITRNDWGVKGTNCEDNIRLFTPTLFQFKHSQSPSFSRLAKNMCGRAQSGGRERRTGNTMGDNVTKKRYGETGSSRADCVYF